MKTFVVWNPKSFRPTMLALAIFCLLTVARVGFAETAPNSKPNGVSATPVSSNDSPVPSLEELGLPAAPVQSAQQGSAPSPDQSQGKTQNTPPGNNGLSLQGLGFSASQTQGSAQEQARLNKRTHMLKIHQTLGLITLVPMVATVFSGGGAKAKRGPNGTYTEPSSASLDTHVALGATTGALYAATAYYAIFAPKIPDEKPRGAIRVHRYLEYVHGPGMLLTGILGIDAYKQENAGEKVHGIASAHGTVADVTLAAYAASIVAVSWPIHLKFWERR